MEKGIYKSQVHEREEKLFVQIKHMDALMRWRKKYINLKSWGRKYMNLNGCERMRNYEMDKNVYKSMTMKEVYES